MINDELYYSKRSVRDRIHMLFRNLSGGTQNAHKKRPQLQQASPKIRTENFLNTDEGHYVATHLLALPVMLWLILTLEFVLRAVILTFLSSCIKMTQYLYTAFLITVSITLTV